MNLISYININLLLTSFIKTCANIHRKNTTIKTRISRNQFIPLLLSRALTTASGLSNWKFIRYPSIRQTAGLTLCPFLPILRFLSLYTEQPGSAIKRKKSCKLKRKQNIPCKQKNIRERPFMSLPDDCDSEIDQLILCRRYYITYHITKYKSSTFLLSCYTFRNSSACGEGCQVPVALAWQRPERSVDQIPSWLYLHVLTDFTPYEKFFCSNCKALG